MNDDSKAFSDDALPPALLSDLQAVQHTPAIPPSVDSRVRAQARDYFARQRRIRIWVRAASGMAAAVLLVVGMRLAMPPAQHEMAPQMAAQHDASPSAAPSTSAEMLANPDILQQDIDRSGVVDILDAFAVARGIKRNQTQPAWDITGDGHIDRQDVEQLAAAAVTVKGGVQ